MTRRIACLFVVAAALLGVQAWRRPHPSEGTAADASLELLATRGERTRPVLLRVHRDSHGRLSFAAAPIPANREIVHAPDAAVRGVSIGRGESLVTAQTEDTGELAFASALWRVGPDGATRLLDGVALASRPVVWGRRAYVQRGRVAPTAAPARAMREDDLSVTELDLDHGTTRNVVALRGQLAFPIGVDDDLGLVAYLIGGEGTLGEGGRLVAFSTTTLTPRELGVIGTARDFSLVPQAVVDGRALGPSLVYEAIRPHARSVEVRTLDGGAATWHRGSTLPLAPFVLPGGQLFVAQRRGDGSIEVVRGYSPTLHVVLVARYAPDRPLPHFLLRSTDGTNELGLDTVAPPSARLEPIGFTELP